MHEEPFGLAVAEVLALRWLRARGTPFLVCSAQNLEKRYPPPFRWFERWSLRRAAGAYTCNLEAGRILRRKGLVGELALLPARRRHRAVPPGRPGPPRRAGCGWASSAGSSRTRGRPSCCGRLPATPGSGPRSTGPGPSRADAAGAGRPARDRRPGRVRRPRRRRPDARCLPLLDVLAVPSVAMPGWVEQFGRVVVEAQAPVSRWWPARVGPSPTSSAIAGSSCRRVTRSALAGALVRLLDEPGLWSRLREAGVRDAGRSSWERMAGDQQALYERALSAAAPERSPRPPDHRPVELLEPVEVAASENRPAGVTRSAAPSDGGGPDRRPTRRARGPPPPRPRARTGSRPHPPSRGGPRPRPRPRERRGPWPRPPRGRTAPRVRERGGSTNRRAGASVSATCPAKRHARRAPESSAERLEVGTELTVTRRRPVATPTRRARCTTTPGCRPRGPSPGRAAAASRTVGASRAAWADRAPPFGMRTDGPEMVRATNSLMAMSQAIDREVTRPAPVRYGARAAIAGEVTSGDGRQPGATGRADQAATSAAVMWAWTRSASCTHGRARGGPRQHRCRRPVVDRGGQLVAHPHRIPADDRDAVAAGGQPVGHLADVALDTGEGVGQHDVHDREGPGSDPVVGAASTRQRSAPVEREPGGRQPAPFAGEDAGPGPRRRPGPHPGRPTSPRCRGACGGSARGTHGSGPRRRAWSPPVPDPTWVAVTPGQRATIQPTIGGPALPVGLLGVEEEPVVERADVGERLAPDAAGPNR